MRKTLTPYPSSFLKLFAGSLLLILFAVSGCKKNDLTVPAIGSPNKVLTYLESQKVAGLTNKNANIDLLKESLDLSAARTERLDKKIDLLVVPVKDEVINKKNLDKNSTITLVLLTDKAGKISSGSIVYFQPADGQKHHSLPQNTLSNLFGGKAKTLDGTYKMLTVTGNALSQFKIQGGRIVSTGVFKGKEKENNGTQRINLVCIDWYLITTYYYADGSTTTTSEYVGTTCVDGGCDNPDYESHCPDVEGGGGGGNGPNVLNGNDEASMVESEPAPDINGGPSAGGNEYPVTWRSTLTYAYNYQTMSFDFVLAGKPYAVPPVQPYIDSYGNAGLLYVDCLTWSYSKTPLTLKSVWIRFNFISERNWVLSNGVISRYTFDELMSKVLAVP